MAKNYWEILGLSPDAGALDIKKAFRALARQYHPDANRNDPRAEEKFKEINEAYRVLSDPRRRAQYQAGDGTDIGFASPFSSAGDFGEIYDIFGEGWGRPVKRVTPETGADLFVELEIALAEAALGAQRIVHVEGTGTCSTCQGSGARPGTTPEVCGKCNGSGEMQEISNTVFGRFVGSARCDACGGEGTTVKEACSTCDGTRVIPVQTQLSVHIPAGVETGSELRAAGYGEPGQRGGDHGDLYLLIKVMEDSPFRRQGDDLTVDVPISVSQAALGTTLQVPTIDGQQVALEVPRGSQYGDEIALDGLGVLQEKTGTRGRQIARLVLVAPTNLSAAEETLFRELAKIRGEYTH